uniref:Yippee domain-containing protein n=1 Tax=Heterosigma akashiwo TaxID=2829 RepID=A0A6S9FLP3_HETAK|mmetsp:Transcript_4681/g.7775  ORF Transcript_4681/g.7775 Transcript_4681/m.7775 type:complete len:279 (+) Transcript_4681:173-1009(+)
MTRDSTEQDVVPFFKPPTSGYSANQLTSSLPDLKWLILSGVISTSIVFFIAMPSHGCTLFVYRHISDLWQKMRACGGCMIGGCGSCATKQRSTLTSNNKSYENSPSKRRTSGNKNAPSHVLVEGTLSSKDLRHFITKDQGGNEILPTGAGQVRGGGRRRRLSPKAPTHRPAVHLLGPAVYCCAGCGTPQLSADAVVSRAFHGRGGRAFLVETVVNCAWGKAEDRQLMTGWHAIADVRCRCCGATLGWTYERAFEPSQKYKEGKFVVETSKLILEKVSS